jgi:hypothetical protein
MLVLMVTEDVEQKKPSNCWWVCKLVEQILKIDGYYPVKLKVSIPQGGVSMWWVVSPLGCRVFKKYNTKWVQKEPWSSWPKEQRKWSW